MRAYISGRPCRFAIRISRLHFGEKVLFNPSVSASTSAHSPLIEPLEHRQLLALFVVTSAADAGPGTLRQAILDVNATAEPDTINFAIGTGPQTIAPASPLPPVLDRVTVNGRTQPGYYDVPIIRLSGLNAGPDADGLNLFSNLSQVTDLAITDFSDDGLVLSGSGAHFVTRCYFGVAPGDARAAGNGGDGIEINSSHNYIGGYGGRPDGNVISGNGGDGIRIAAVTPTGQAWRNFVYGNYVGTDPTGRAFVPNRGNGIHVLTAENTIGGASENLWNVISGNAAYNVALTGGAASNVVVSNTIGLNSAGEILPGAGAGVLLGGGGLNSLVGNVISGNSGAGVDLNASAWVTSNFIGTDRLGTRALGNAGHGVIVRSGAILRSNVISANGGDGVRIDGEPVTGVRVEANRIGLSASTAQEQADLGNRGDGVAIVGGDQNTLSDNLIAGNGGNGVRITGGSPWSAARNTIRGNTIGDPFPNDLDGVLLEEGAFETAVGGVGASANTISGNRGSGVRIEGAANKVFGNRIGVTTEANAIRANGRHGIEVTGIRNVIGGTTEGAGNIIAGNTLSGVAVLADGTANEVYGNRIGTFAGFTPLPNGQHGVLLLGAQNLVGSTAMFGHNVIVGNVGSGIFVSGKAAFNKVQHNLVGENGRPNAHGVVLEGGARRNVIGGTRPNESNYISSNAGAGVLVRGGAGDNAILGNWIGNNGGLGIDLGEDGVTPNDELDADHGSNDLQNFPVITSAVITGDTLMVRGTIASTPFTTFHVDFFTSAQEESGGHSEGQRYIGSTHVSANADGNGAFEAVFRGDMPAGSWITATATATARNGGDPLSTSEFSAAVRALLPPPRVTGVYVNGMDWSTPFLAELAEEGLGGPDGYRVGPGTPGPTLVPWSNANQVRVQFNRDVSAQLEDLHLNSAAGVGYVIRSFSYNPSTYTAIWFLDHPLADYPRRRRAADVVDLRLDGDSPDGVHAVDLGGRMVFLPDGDFTHRLHAVPGDVNRNGNVSPTDYGTVRSGVGRNSLDEGVAPNQYTVWKDVNGDGSVSPTDVGVVRGNAGANVGDLPRATGVPQDRAVASITSDLYGTGDLLE
jgi:hypothetical protein